MNWANGPPWMFSRTGCGSLARRLHEPAVDGVAVGGRDRELERFDDSGAGAQRCGEVGQDAQLPVVEHGDVPGGRRVGETDHERSSAGGGAGDHTLALDQDLVAPGGLELEQLDRSPGVVQQQHRVGPAQFEPAVAAEVHRLDVAQRGWRRRRPPASRRARCCAPRSPGPTRQGPGRGRTATARPVTRGRRGRSAGRCWPGRRVPAPAPLRAAVPHRDAVDAAGEIVVAALMQGGREVDGAPVGAEARAGVVGGGGGQLPRGRQQPGRRAASRRARAPRRLPRCGPSTPGPGAPPWVPRRGPEPRRGRAGAACPRCTRRRSSGTGSR